MRGGNTTVTEIFGIGFAIISLAALGLIISKGDKTVKVIKATGNAFTKSIRAATFQK